jgi:hypothetical protein
MIAPLLLALLSTQAPSAPPSAVSSTDAPPVEAPSDAESPNIEDLAVAAANPAAPPMITAVFSDDASGVKLAEVFFRKPGDASYEKAEFAAGQSGIFIARLPDGLQRSGFEYYVEVVDAAGNPPSRLGSADRPLVVNGATESTAARLERRAIEERIEPSIHPGWTMLALGVGVAAGAGAGVFAYDWNVTRGRIDAVDEVLAANPSDVAAQDQRAALQNAQLLDGTIGALLGVVGAAGLAIGVTMVVLSAVE